MRSTANSCRFAVSDVTAQLGVRCVFLKKVASPCVTIQGVVPSLSEPNINRFFLVKICCNLVITLYKKDKYNIVVFL